MSTTLVALCSIHRTPKSGPRSEMTGYDDAGNPIMMTTAEIIAPGSLFEEDDATEIAWLRENNAVRDPTPQELRALGLPVSA